MNLTDIAVAFAAAFFVASVVAFGIGATVANLDKPHAEPVRRSDLLERLRKYQEN